MLALLRFYIYLAVFGWLFCVACVMIRNADIVFFLYLGMNHIGIYRI